MSTRKLAARTAVVMVRKIAYVNRTRRANSAFMACYDRLRGDVTNLEAQLALQPRDIAVLQGSSLYRIHGSNEPWTIGTNVSSGCIRMRNEDVIDRYTRVKVGTKVVVI